MPHQCTNCARVFDDGSKEMLSGCPNCGGNKFQFKPGADADVEPTAEPPDPPDVPGGASVARTVSKTAATVRDLMGNSNAADPSVAPTDADSLRPTTPASSREDTAQASARTDFATADELPTETIRETEHRFQPVQHDADSDTAADGPKAEDEPTASASQATSDRGPAASDHGPAASDHGPAASTRGAPSGAHEAVDQPDLDELRAELNDQFESIKVLSPGHYELNLMELYDREEYIVALQEDGRYSIQVPENFRE